MWLGQFGCCEFGYEAVNVIMVIMFRVEIEGCYKERSCKVESCKEGSCRESLNSMRMEELVMDRVGTIFNIQRFSVQDGPGIRTLVFLKGCPLTCLWCCNPESRGVKPDVLFRKMKCLGCDRCVGNCPKGAIRSVEGGRVIDREKCDLCMECVRKCYAGALETAGEEKSVTEIVEEVLKDWQFYGNSGGGVTLSGGEPLMQPEFAADILRECKRNGIHTAIETCGYARWENYEKLLGWLDLVLFDLKQMDSKMHRKVTGVPNERILENLEKLVRAGKQVIVRLPLIPGINAHREHIEKVGRFCQELSIAQAHLLPYHKLGVQKYEALGIAYPLEELGAVSDEELEEFRRILEGYGITVTIYNHS